MSISRWRDKKAVVHIHSEVLLRHQKEYIWICSNEVDETGAYYIEWVSQKEKHQYSILIHIYMEFRKMVTNILYARQQKRHRCIEQSFGHCWRGRGWDDLGEWHWKMYNIIYEMNCLSKFNAWYRMPGASALGWPRGMVLGGRWEGGSVWGTRIYPWQIHVNVWQNQYNTVKKFI